MQSLSHVRGISTCNPKVVFRCVFSESGQHRNVVLRLDDRFDYASCVSFSCVLATIDILFFRLGLCLQVSNTGTLYFNGGVIFEDGFTEANGGAIANYDTVM